MRYCEGINALLQNALVSNKGVTCTLPAAYKAIPFITEKQSMTYKFTSSFPYLLNRVGVKMGELFSARLVELGLTLPMYRVMAVLRQEGAQSLGDLSAMITIEVSTLSRLITTMQRKGLVTRARTEHNGRMVSITLAPSGEQLVEQLMPLAAHFESVATQSFNDEQIAWLKQALIQIHNDLEKV